MCPNRNRQTPPQEPSPQAVQTKQGQAKPEEAEQNNSTKNCSNQSFSQQNQKLNQLRQRLRNYLARPTPADAAGNSAHNFAAADPADEPTHDLANDPTHDPAHPYNRQPKLACSNWRALGFFWLFISAYASLILLAIGLVFVASGLDSWLIYKVKGIIDAADLTQQLAGFAVILVVAMTIRTAALLTSSYLFNSVQARVELEVSRALFAQVSAMPRGFFEIHGEGKLISRIHAEVDMLGRAFGALLLSLAKDFSMIVGLLVVMFLSNWQLSGLLLVLVPVIVFIIGRVAKAIKKLANSAIDQSQERMKLLAEMIKGQQTLALYNAQEQEQQAFTNQLTKIRKVTEKSLVVNNIGNGLIQVVAAMVLAGIIFVAAYANDLGLKPVSSGDFVIIFTSMFTLLKPLRNLLASATQFVGALEVVKSALGLLALRTEAEQAQLIATQKGAAQSPNLNKDKSKDSPPNYQADIHLNNITFSYPTQTTPTPVLENFSLTFKAGKTYALVGKSGSGKSTILSLLPRLYEVDQGQILLGEHDLSLLDLQELRRNISVVSQKVHLRDASIADNIAYGANYPRAQIAQAAKAAYVDEFADDLDMQVGADGARLSGGQRQRIAIARAFLRQSPILLLDEATSALDNQSEHFIQQSLAKLAEGKTVIVVAHRLATVKNADCILVLEQGKLVQQGTYQELMAQEGAFKQLAMREFSAD